MRVYCTSHGGWYDNSKGYCPVCSGVVMNAHQDFQIRGGSYKKRKKEQKPKPQLERTE